MCFLKHSISAWRKRKSLWHSPSMDLEGVMYLETSHFRRKEKTVLNKWIWWSTLQHEILWNEQLLSSSIPGRNTNYSKLFGMESWTLLLNLPSKTNLKNIPAHWKMRSGNLEAPIKARFMHCVTGRMFHSHEEVQAHSKRKAKTILRAMLQQNAITEHLVCESCEEGNRRNNFKNQDFVKMQQSQLKTFSCINSQGKLLCPKTRNYFLLFRNRFFIWTPFPFQMNTQRTMAFLFSKDLWRGKAAQRLEHSIKTSFH